MYDNKHNIPSALITCSCGAQTIVRFSDCAPTSDPDELGRFVPDHQTWKFRTVAEADEYEREHGQYINCGWYCGESGHEQVKSREIEMLSMGGRI